MADAVADDEPRGTDDRIIPRNLIKRFLTDDDIGRLVFDDDKRAQLTGVDEGVAATRRAVETETHFIRHERLPVTFRVDKIVDEMLSDIFLGREGHSFAAQTVVDLDAAVVIAGDFYVEVG